MGLFYITENMVKGSESAVENIQPQPPKFQI